jgi:hypothetical protein
MTGSSQDREIHAGWKLSWIESLSTNRAIKGIGLKVAIVVSQRADRQGVALVSQESIAKRIGSVERVIRRELQLLISLGYIESIKDGRRPGRGCAGQYRLLKRRAVQTAEARTQESRTQESEKADSGVRKGGLRSPPLPISSKDNPSARVRARAREPDGLSWLERCWWTIKERLARSEHFGEDKVEAWLSKLRVGGIAVSEVILIAPSKFLATKIETDYGDMLLREWRTIDPTIKRVSLRVVVAASTPTPGDQGVVLPLREQPVDVGGIGRSAGAF